jgi:protein-S-isoprenylcysteine O-methyltransferase Ste14
VREGTAPERCGERKRWCSPHMKKSKRKKKKKGTGSKPRTLSAGWGTFFVLVALFGVVAWVVPKPFLSEDASVLVRFTMVLVIAAVCASLATYLLNSTLAAWSKWRRKRS